MPLDPAEIAKAIAAIVRCIPRLVRWRKLDKEARHEVVDDLGTALSVLILDIAD